jgi:hypothetical protein
MLRAVIFAALAAVLAILGAAPAFIVGALLLARIELALASDVRIVIERDDRRGGR